MLGDPRLGVRIGFERADPGRMTVRDADLDTESTVVKRDYAIGRFGVGVRLWHCNAARSLIWLAKEPASGSWAQGSREFVFCSAGGASNHVGNYPLVRSHARSDDRTAVTTLVIGVAAAPEQRFHNLGPAVISRA
jgi:hypothetical protein